MSKLITLSTLIGLVAIVALAASDEKCSSCLKRAAEIKSNLTSHVIDVWETNTTIYCHSLKPAREIESCISMSSSSSKQLNHLLLHSEREFCQWLGDCKTSLMGLPQLSLAINQVLNPTEDATDMECRKCKKAAFEVKSILTPQLFSKVVQFKSSECFQNSAEGELDQCLAQVAKLNYVLSYLMAHSAEDFCSWESVCKNTHAQYEIAQTWEEIQTQLRRSSCEKCLEKASTAKEGLSAESIDAIVKSANADCDKVLDKTLQKRCFLRIAEYESELKHLLNHTPLESCQLHKACPARSVTLANIMNL